jgi:ABC-type multidrug transport system fused ATPase/permease subunit
MGFVLDGLDTESYDRAYSDRDLVRRIVGYFRPYSRQMALVACMITLDSVAGTAAPILIAKAVDLVAQNPSTPRISPTWSLWFWTCSARCCWSFSWPCGCSPSTPG